MGAGGHSDMFVNDCSTSVDSISTYLNLLRWWWMDCNFFRTTRNPKSVSGACGERQSRVEINPKSLLQCCGAAQRWKKILRRQDSGRR